MFESNYQMHGFAHFNSLSVTIIPRDQWHADLPKKRASLSGMVQRVVIHHTDTRTSSNPSEGRDIVKSIQQYHMTNRDFDDIGYK